MADKKILDAFSGGVFDLDGVLTKTAKVHAATWKELFDDYLRLRAERDGEPYRPFDIERDYRRYVDGKPRYEGVRSFLESRGVELAYGSIEDSPEQETICGLGNRKNEFFNARLVRDGVEVFDTSVSLIQELRQKGVKTALVSSSKNARSVLDAAALTDLFDVCVDGTDADRLHLRGKPDPDIFTHAVEMLEIEPGDAFAVEDAISGVESAHAAGYGLVIGLDRNGQAAALREHGADLVLSDLGELVDDEPTQARLPNASVDFHEIEQRLVNKRVAIFLDYDGTLTPIVDRPELAVLSEEMRAVVQELGRRCPVAVVSGRDRSDVEELVGLSELVYAGSHGFDIAGPNGLSKQHEGAAAYLSALDRAEARLQSTLAGVNGALVERKRYAIAAHYRLVAEVEVQSVEAAVDAALEEASPALRKTGGKKVFELRPNLPWDKGRAVMWLMGALNLDEADVVPVYLGDDETDEDAFRAVRNRGGIGILVAEAPQRTAAAYKLSDTADVGRFLHRLVGLLRETSS